MAGGLTVQVNNMAALDFLLHTSMRMSTGFKTNRIGPVGHMPYQLVRILYYRQNFLYSEGIVHTQYPYQSINMCPIVPYLLALGCGPMARWPFSDS